MSPSSPELSLLLDQNIHFQIRKSIARFSSDSLINVLSDCIQQILLHVKIRANYKKTLFKFLLLSTSEKRSFLSRKSRVDRLFTYLNSIPDAKLKFCGISTDTTEHVQDLHGSTKT